MHKSNNNKSLDWFLWRRNSSISLRIIFMFVDMWKTQTNLIRPKDRQPCYSANFLACISLNVKNIPYKNKTHLQCKAILEKVWILWKWQKITKIQICFLSHTVIKEQAKNASSILAAGDLYEYIKLKPGKAYI